MGLYCNVTTCVSQFTGLFCESCPYFERTVENIKSVRSVREDTIKKSEADIQRTMKMHEACQAETDRIWNDYCKKEKEKQKEADEYAEYLRLKEKFEGV